MNLNEGQRLQPRFENVKQSLTYLTLNILLNILYNIHDVLYISVFDLPSILGGNRTLQMFQRPKKIRYDESSFHGQSSNTSKNSRRRCSFRLCHRSNDQRRLVPSRFIGAGTEERIDGVGKRVGEGEDEKPGLHVVEGHHPLLKVHVDPNPRRPDAERQAGGRLRPEGVFALIPQTEEPVAVGGAYGDLALPVDGPARHPQVPVGLPANVHLGGKPAGECE